MKKTVCIAMAVLAMAGGGVAYAVSGTAQDRPAATATAQKQTTFAIENMTCATCPITVKKALTHVSGVSKTEVSLDRREATVTFDDAKTDVEALTRATKEAGYPSTVVGNAI